jgi:iron complex outermembrane receptor protein
MKKPFAYAVMMAAAWTPWATVRAQAPAPIDQPAPKDETIRLNPFEVSASNDTGYGATESTSASRIATPINDLPIAIDVITPDFIADQKPTNMWDIISWAPGVADQQGYPSGSLNYVVDGFAAPLERNGFTSQAMFMDPVNIDRVEIVKGPSSMLYGQVSPGGIVNYVTKQPQDHWAGELTDQFGDFNEERATIDLTGPIMSYRDNKLDFRITAAAEDEAQFWVNSSGKKLDVSPSLSYQIGSSSKLTVQYEYFNEKLKSPPQGIPNIYYSGLSPSVPQYYTALGSFAGPIYPGLPIWWNDNVIGMFQNSVGGYFSASFTTQLTEHWALRLWADHSSFTFENLISGQGGTNLQPLTTLAGGGVLDATQVPENSVWMREQENHKDYNNGNYEADLTGEYDLHWVKITTLAGYEYSTSYQRSRTINALVSEENPAWDLSNPATWNYNWNGTLSEVTAAQNGAADTRNNAYIWGAFATVNLSFLNDRINILFGDRYNKNFTGGTINNLTGLQTSPNVSTTKWTPQIGGIVKIYGGLSAYVNYSQSFQANNGLLRVDSATGTIPEAPTTATGYNYGLKLEMLQGKLTSTLGLYSITLTPAAIQTFVVGTSGSNTLYTDVQSGSEKGTGLDWDVLYTPVRGWQIYGSYSETDPKFTSMPSTPTEVGLPAANSEAKNAENIWTKYQFQDGMLKGFYVGGGVQRFGSRIYQINPALINDPNPIVREGEIIAYAPYTLYSAMIGYKFDLDGYHWSADITGQNLGDANYQPGANGRAYPRRWLCTLGVKF